MSGTAEGARKARETLLKRNPKHYADMAKLSKESYWATPAEKRKPRGFALDRERASRAGSKSKRG